MNDLADLKITSCPTIADRLVMERLRREVALHDHLYHTLNRPEITDYEYDIIFGRLVELEQQHPELITENSPTQRMTGQVREGAIKSRHYQKMLSLDNIFEKRDLDAFLRKTKTKTVNAPLTVFVAELKVDGVAISLQYNSGQLAHAITRGNGEEGENVTAQARAIKTIPLKLHGDSSNFPEIIEIRGEVYIQKKDLIPTHKTTRNSAAGGLRHKEAKNRKLRFTAHGIGYSRGFNCETLVGMFEQFRAWHLPVFKHWTVSGFKQIQERFSLIEGERESLPFDIDGMVLKVNNIQDQQKLGQTGRSPRWATAYKFKACEDTTQIQDIQFQVGRTGAVTPVAILKPVTIGGVTVSRSTLHSSKNLDEKDYRVGDTVEIKRAGDVIPYVGKVLIYKRPHNAPRIAMPTICPSCGNHLVGETIQKCPGDMTCPAQLLGRLELFAKAMGMKGFGPQLLERLIKERIVNCFHDLFLLHHKRDLILAMPRMARKTFDGLIQQIEASKQLPLERFILSLSIPNVSKQTVKSLCRKIKSIQQLIAATPEELRKAGIGTEKISELRNFWENNASMVNELLEVEGTLWHLSNKKNTTCLDGWSCVLTGSFSTLTRTQAKSRVEMLGGKTLQKVSSLTDVVVCGGVTAGNAKIRDAKNHNIRIIDEKAFIAFLEQHEQQTQETANVAR